MIDLDAALQANQEIIPRIYEAAAVPDRWDEAIQRVVAFCGHRNGSLAIVFLGSGEVELVGTSEERGEYLDLWMQKYGVNEWTMLAAAAPAGEVIHAGAQVPVEQLADTPFGQEMLIPVGVKDGMGVRLSDSQLFVAMFSSVSTRPVTPDQLDRLEFLAPHLGCALNLYQRFSELEQRSEAFTQGIDGLSSGIVLLRADGQVLHANARARAILEQGDGIAEVEGQLRLDDAEDRQALHEAIDQVANPQPAQPRRCFFRIRRRSEGRPYHAVVSPAVPTLVEASAGAVLLWLTDPDNKVVPSEASIRALLGLTRAEARLTAAIASGQSLRAYAEAVGIAESTARWTMKRVLSKTETRSQADLVRLVLQSVPSPPF